MAPFFIWSEESVGIRPSPRVRAGVLLKEQEQASGRGSEEGMSAEGRLRDTAGTSFPPVLDKGNFFPCAGWALKRKVHLCPWAFLPA